MVKVLDYGSSPGQGHCVVFLGKNFTLTLTLSTRVNIRVLTKMYCLV